MLKYREYTSLESYYNCEIMQFKGGNPIKSIGKAFENTIGGLTGGLIGRDPNKAAREEAERQREAERARVAEAEAKAKQEKEYNEKLIGDTKTIENAKTQQQPKAMTKTTTDFSKSIKLGEQEEEDKLKKVLKAGRF